MVFQFGKLAELTLIGVEEGNSSVFPENWKVDKKIFSSSTTTRVHHHLKKVSSSDCNTHNRTKCDRSPQQSGRAAAGVERVQSALKKIQFVKRRESRGLQLSNISLVVVFV